MSLRHQQSSGAEVDEDGNLVDPSEISARCPVPNIEWMCYPHEMIGTIIGTHETGGTLINAHSAALVKQAPLVIKHIRTALFLVEGGAQLVQWAEFKNFHRFTFPDENAYIMARKLQEQCVITPPSEMISDELIERTIDYARRLIRERMQEFPRVRRVPQRSRVIVWDENNNDEIIQARLEYDKLRQNGFRLQPFNARSGEAVGIIRATHEPSEPPKWPVLSSVLQPYCSFIQHARLRNTGTISNEQ